MNDEPIFICDAPPGLRFVIEADGYLAAYEKAWIERFINARIFLMLETNGRVTLPNGREVDINETSGEWPDAEFCAA